MSERIHLIVVSDHLLFSECLALALSKFESVEVVEVITEIKDVINKVKSKQPDCVLIDVDLPNNGAFELIGRIALQVPQVKLIILGVADSEGFILKCIEAGASSYLLKGASLEDLLSNIQSVYRGEAACSPTLAYSMFSKVTELALNRSNRNILSSMNLTPREIEVLRLIAEGLSNKQIAQQLNLSLYTVKNHVHNIIEKLNLHNRLEVARYALDNGLTSSGRRD